MKTETRQDLIERLEQDLDGQLNIVTQNFQNLDDEQLNKKGEEGGWSIAQNLDHLNMYFDYYIPAVRGAIEKAKEAPDAAKFHSGWLGGYFTKMMDYRNNKKSKAFKDYIPKDRLNSAEVVQKFIENEEEFLKLLRTTRNYDLTRIRLAISLTRWITMRLGDVFQFVIMHNERHLMQALSRL